MALILGEIYKTADLVIDNELTKTNVTTVVGDVCVFDTDGWVQAGATSIGPFGIFLTAVTLDGTQQYVRVMKRGVVVVNKVAGNDIYPGQRVKNVAVGEIDLWVAPDWPAAFNEVSCQAEIDILTQIVGVCKTKALNADTVCKVRLGAW